jgi:hypothetical protein
MLYIKSVYNLERNHSRNYDFSLARTILYNILKDLKTYGINIFTNVNILLYNIFL